MKWKKYLPIIGILLFLYILFKLDLSNILNEIASAKTSFLLIAMLFVFIMFITQTLKWFIIARKQGINVPFKKAIKINFITEFYSFMVPSKLGSIFRVEYLKKYAGGRGKAFSNFVLEKILDLFSVFFIAILFVFIVGSQFDIIPKYFLLTIFLIGALIFLLFLKKERSKSVLKIFHNYLIPKKFKEKAKRAFEAFYEKMPKKRDFLFFSMFNLLNWIILYSSTYWIGRSLGIDLPFYYFLAILPIGTIVALLPITFNGLGTREATLITLFLLFGIGRTKVFSMSILSLVIAGLFPAIIGSFLIFKDKKNL